MKNPTPKPSLKIKTRPVPIKYIYNNIYNKLNSNKLRASTRVEAKTKVVKGSPYKDQDFVDDLDYILSRGVEIPDDYEVIEIT